MEPPRYFYSRGGTDDSVGPVSLDDLRLLAHRGEIKADTAVIKEGEASWRTWRDYSANGQSASATSAAPRVPAMPPARSGVDRFLRLNFRFGKVVAAVIGAFFLLVFVGSLIFAALASGDSVKAPTLEDLRPASKASGAAPQNFTQLDENRAVEKRYGDEMSDIVKTFGLRSSDYDSIKRMLVELPDKYRRQYIKGLRRVLESRNEFVKKNGAQSVSAAPELTVDYSASFSQSVANNERGAAEALMTRLIAIGVAAVSCLAAFIMMTIPAILMIEQNTRKLAAAAPA